MRISVLICFALVAVSRPAAAVPPAQRIVVIDALELTPVLEKTDARFKMHGAVVATIQEHGWEPVVSTDCHDAGCIGAASAAVHAKYALVVVGRFAPHQQAAEVETSLWHEGIEIAQWTEGDEEKEVNQLHVGNFLRCGAPGFCTTALATTKFVLYTSRLLEREDAAIRDRERATAVAAAAAFKAPAPVDAPKPVAPAAAVAEQPVRGGGWSAGRVLGWSAIGAGVVLAGGAVALWAANGSLNGCTPAAGDGDACRHSRDTATAAAVSGMAAVLVAAGGVVVLLMDRGDSKMALSVQPTGFQLRGHF
jgi:hypothetical protein